MIMHMIQLNEETRFSAGECLDKWTPTVFRAYYSPLLHNFFSCLVPLDTDTRVAVTQGAFPEIRKQMLADSQKRQQSREVGGIADVVFSKGVSLSPLQKKDELPAGDFIVDHTPSMDDSTHHLLEGQARSLTSLSLPHVKAAAVAIGEAASAVEEVVTEEVRIKRQLLMCLRDARFKDSIVMTKEPSAVEKVCNRPKNPWVLMSNLGAFGVTLRCMRTS
jgi:hypothetical protein